MNRDELLRRLARILDDESLHQAVRDLERLDIDDTTHWLTQIVEAAEALPLPEVPPVLSQDLKNLIAKDRLITAVEAQLVSDTRIDRQLAGVRGAETGEGWSLSFTSEVADLVIDVWPEPSGALAVEGQVMAHGATASAYRASVAGPKSVAVEGDRLGRFDLGQLDPGRYDLTVSNGRIQLSAVLDLSGSSQ